MDSEPHLGQLHDGDEGAWIYLCQSQVGGEEHVDLHRQVAAACERSGWSSVSWSPRSAGDSAEKSSRYFEGMSHAVENADAVVVLIDQGSAITDVELAFAFTHDRPVIGLRVGGREPGSEIQSMIDLHGRGRVVDCPGFGDCADALHAALSDPWLSERGGDV